MQTRLREVTPIPCKKGLWGSESVVCFSLQTDREGACFPAAMSREACSPALSHRGGPVALIPSDTMNPCSCPHGISECILELEFVCMGHTL